jgi:hypothetical protein
MASAFDDPSVSQHDYLVELIEPVAVVGDEQRRVPGGRGQDVPGQRAAGIGIQVGGRLVEYQQRGALADGIGCVQHCRDPPP